jgi:hypothetical protein
MLRAGFPPRNDCRGGTPWPPLVADSFINESFAGPRGVATECHPYSYAKIPSEIESTAIDSGLDRVSAQ